MSLKAVELQVALPRTLDNSRNQQIQQNQASLQNAMDGEQLTQQTIVNDQTVGEAEDKDRAQWRDRQKGPGPDPRKGRRASAGEPESAQAPHPFKGHRLDIKM
ncbi:hypothetical protein JJB07_20285 [Tumebacillus sp. ITR2]|uniref:Uncharacterized protein n=1 Tax=Tumebacillus amylolyticus TaxID=2801339 RepID=A0ABS1JG12_9BACL|nr:hypothetical protein [Tumebacillus amylolyticus]MBL0388939.1 hypothetical protein [Tumebacillus amylolyticus]